MQLVRRPGSRIRTAAHNWSAYYIDTFGKCRVSISTFLQRLCWSLNCHAFAVTIPSDKTWRSE